MRRQPRIYEWGRVKSGRNEVEVMERRGTLFGRKPEIRKKVAYVMARERTMSKDFGQDVMRAAELDECGH